MSEIIPLNARADLNIKIIDSKTVEHPNGWSQIITVYRQPVVVSPPWWQIWNKPIVKMKTFTSSAYVKDGNSVYAPQTLEQSA